MTIKEIVKKAHKTAQEKGWHDRPLSVPEQLALIHSEVSEALESFRVCQTAPHCEHRGEYTHVVLPSDVQCDGKPVGFPSELADIVIRVAHLAGWMEIDLERAIREKMAYNATRPHRHGGKVL